MPRTGRVDCQNQCRSDLYHRSIDDELPIDGRSRELVKPDNLSNRDDVRAWSNSHDIDNDISNEIEYYNFDMILSNRH
jgi:hypothetical protein